MDISWSRVSITCGLVAGTAVLWNKVRFSDNTRKRVKTCEGDKVSVLPRLFLIEGLLENVERLQLEMESHGKEDFASRLCEILDVVKQAVNAGEGNGLNRCIQVMDAELVAFLSAVLDETGTGSILDTYLPRAGQTWNSFLQNKTKEEQEFFRLEITSEQFPHSELKEHLLGSIEKLKSTLNQSLAQDSTDPIRSTDDGDEVEAISPRRYHIVNILYATDRQVTTDGEYIGLMSKRSPSQPLHYGWVEIGIPATHKEGFLETPALLKEEADPCKHVVVLSVNTNPRGDFDLFVKCINDDRATIGNGTGELLVYIHGYNARHLDTLKRVAQLKCDLKFKGTVILYSWSSKGTLSRYRSDEKNVRRTEYSLQAFLKNIMHKVQAPRVHILAHSMGTRALVGALLNLDAEQNGHHLLCPLSQIILVAADEERSRFEDLVRKLNKMYESTTSVDLAQTSESIGRIYEDQNGVESGALDTRPHLSVYCSTGDWPLALSKLFHGGCRLGDTESLFKSASDATLGGHDVIDASYVKGPNAKHHSYHLESPIVIKDIRNLLAQRMPARRRSILNPIRNRGRDFYAFDTTFWTSNVSCSSGLA